MARKKKSYIVNLDMRWSHDIKVKANGSVEAKKIAFNKLVKKLKQNYFNINVELNE